MDPLTLAGLASTGIGLIGSLFGDSRQERVERFYNNLRAQAQRDLDKFEREGRSRNQSRRRTQKAGSINQIRTAVAQRGLAGTTFGIGEVNKAISSANVASNAAEDDFDLNILNRQAQVNQIQAPPSEGDPFGFTDLFGAGVNILGANLTNSSRRAKSRTATNNSGGNNIFNQDFSDPFKQLRQSQGFGFNNNFLRTG